MKILNAISLLLGLLGTWLLAYEIIWGYKKKLRARYAEIRLGYLQGDLLTLNANTDKLSPVYRSDEIIKIKAEYSEKYGKLIAHEEGIIKNATVKHAEDSTLLALLGAILITASYAIQAYVIYIAPK